MARGRALPGTVRTRLRAHAPSLLLAAASAGIAYLVAGLLFGPQGAVFAPVAAVVTTGLTAGQRILRAGEISIGVVLGVVAADLLSRWLGVGPLQLTLAVLLAMAAAVAVRPSGLLANQAAVAAVVVMVMLPFLDTGPWVRLGDALVGGAVAVALNAIVAPDPYRTARSLTVSALSRLEELLRRICDALSSASLAEAEAALEDVAGLDSTRADITAALSATRERLVWRPAERRHRPAGIVSIERVAGRVVILLSTVRGIARAAANLVRRPPAAAGSAGGLAEALELLVAAVAELRLCVAGTGRVEQVRVLALQSAARASAQLPGAQNRAVMVGQIRSAAVDLLRATGASQREAVAALEEAAGRADELGP